MIPLFDFDGTLLDTKVLDPYIYFLRQTTDKSVKKSIWKHIYSHIKDCTLYSGFQEVFDYITENRLASAIVTNSAIQKTVPCCKQFNIPIPKQYQIGGYTLNRFGNIKKPNPRLIFEATKRLNIDPSEAVMIGNSSKDILTAKNAHIASVACTWDADDIDVMMSLNPTYTVHHPSELIPILEK